MVGLVVQKLHHHHPAWDRGQVITMWVAFNGFLGQPVLSPFVTAFRQKIALFKTNGF